MQQLSSQLQAVIDADQANFIILYLQSGGEPDTVTTLAGGRPDLTKPATTTLKSVLDVIGATVTIKDPSQKETSTPTNPFSSDTGSMGTYLPTLMDQTTVHQGLTIPGRININLAPQTVLEAIPGMTDDIVQSIMEKREDDPVNAPPDQQYETWILTEGIVTLRQMQALEPFITCGGNVFRGQVVGYLRRGRAGFAGRSHYQCYHLDALRVILERDQPLGPRVLAGRPEQRPGFRERSQGSASGGQGSATGK